MTFALPVLSDRASRPALPAEGPPVDPAVVPPESWMDWKWQLRHRLSTKEELAALLALTPDEERGMDAAPGLFRVGITPYYFSLIDRAHTACPVRMQVVPRAGELVTEEGDLVDPLGEDSHSPATGIFHRYPDRCLLLAVDRCAIYCRHCNRRRLVGQEESPISREDLRQAVGYIRRTPAIRDVLISGGDPLTLTTDRLEEIVAEVRAIPHVEIIRIGTREPMRMIST
jgi:lysine 2,3-aminomutase